MPIGYSKSAGLSFMLDALATLLSSGDSVICLGECAHAYDVSQVFIAFDLEKVYPEPDVSPITLHVSPTLPSRLRAFA